MKWGKRREMPVRVVVVDADVVRLSSVSTVGMETVAVARGGRIIEVWI